MRIPLLPHTAEHSRALREGADAYARLSGYRLADGLAELVASPEISSDFQAKQDAAAPDDIWFHGFGIVHPGKELVVGLCGYKGPPTVEGTVEISYGIAAEYRNRGYATAAAEELVSRAFASQEVRLVLAHTLAEPNPSTTVLAKCGFSWIGEVTDPEDGAVWKWERPRA